MTLNIIYLCPVRPLRFQFYELTFLYRTQIMHPDVLSLHVFSFKPDVKTNLMIQIIS